MASKTRVTLKDIATKCGYSVNTVSRALRGDERLPEETLERIRHAASEVGYIRNSLASSLRSGKSNVIAIIIEELQNQHYSALLDLLSLYLSRQGYRVMILTSRHDVDLGLPSSEQLSLSVAYAVSHAVDGVFFFPNRDDADCARTLQDNRIPLVLIDREIDGLLIDTVRVDDYEGGCQAARLLLEKGHKNIMYLAGPPYNGSQALREAGFLDTLSSQGIRREDVLKIPHHLFMKAIAESALDELLFPVEYTAVFSFNDQMAYYLLGCLRNNGILVPEDVSVLGFDYIRNSFPYMPLLSTFGIHQEREMAAEAVRLMIERIEEPDRPPQRIILPVEYVEGGTLGPLTGQEEKEL